VGRLGAARVAAYERLTPLLPLAAQLPPLDGLRLALAGLSDEADHLVVTAAIPVALASILRGGKAIAPDPTLGHAADFLRMLHGTVDPARAAALDAYLATVAEHGMNASTFTARVIASTRAGVVASVVGALCALKGPLHGGAPGPVLDMLDAIGKPANIGPWLAKALADGDRLMGFGHRIYRVRDPRADVLKGVVARLRSGGDARLAFAEQVEREALAALAAHKPDRKLDTNVEFYTALLLEALGLPREAFTAVFAMGRVAGWTAHVYEQLREGRLMRPQSVYVGP
jgi:citrate synthase